MSAENSKLNTTPLSASPLDSTANRFALTDALLADAKNRDALPLHNPATGGNSILRGRVWWGIAIALFCVCAFLFRPVRSWIDQIFASSFDPRLSVRELHYFPNSSAVEAVGMRWMDRAENREFGFSAAKGWMLVESDPLCDKRLLISKALLSDARLFLEPSPDPQTIESLDRGPNSELLASRSLWEDALAERMGTLDWNGTRSSLRDLAVVDKEFDELERKISDWRSKARKITDDIEQIRAETNSLSNPLRFEEQLRPVLIRLERLDESRLSVVQSFAVLQRFIGSELRRMKELCEQDKAIYQELVAEQVSEAMLKDLQQSLLTQLIREHWSQRVRFLETGDRLARSIARSPEASAPSYRQLRSDLPDFAFRDFNASGLIVSGSSSRRSMSRGVEVGVPFSLVGQFEKRLEPFESSRCAWRYQLELADSELLMTVCNRSNNPRLYDLQLGIRHEKPLETISLSDSTLSRDSVGDSVGDSAGDSVGDSAGDTAGDTDSDTGGYDGINDYVLFDVWDSSDTVEYQVEYQIAVTCDGESLEGTISLTDEQLLELARAQPNVARYLPGSMLATQSRIDGTSADQDFAKEDTFATQGLTVARVNGTWDRVELQIEDRLSNGIEQSTAPEQSWLRMAIERMIAEKLDTVAANVDLQIDQRYAVRVARLDRFAEQASVMTDHWGADHERLLRSTVAGLHQQVSEAGSIEFAREKASIRMR